MAVDILKKVDVQISSLFGIKQESSYMKYARALFGIVVGVALLGSAYWGYFSYKTSQEKQAQKILSECIEQFERASYPGSMGSLWPSVEMACQLGYEQHSSSSLAPYFLAYEADALLAQKKDNEAIAVMGNMMNLLSSDSPLYDMYATKYALMQLDAADEKTHVDGLNALQALGSKESNKQKDIALYYLGSYYESVNDIAAAKNTWEQLVAIESPDAEYASPWIAHVKERLNQLS